MHTCGGCWSWILGKYALKCMTHSICNLGRIWGIARLWHRTWEGKKGSRIEMGCRKAYVWALWASRPPCWDAYRWSDKKRTQSDIIAFSGFGSFPRHSLLRSRSSSMALGCSEQAKWQGCALAREELDEGTFSSKPQLEDLAKRKVGSFKCAWVNDADRIGFKEPSDSVAVAYNKWTGSNS